MEFEPDCLKEHISNWEQKEKIKEILESLLSYEGPKDQTMKESALAQKWNNRLIDKASEFGIKLNLENTVRNK